jgi:hypothetical protein
MFSANYYKIKAMKDQPKKLEALMQKTKLARMQTVSAIELDIHEWCS